MSTSVRRLHAADIPDLCSLDYAWRQRDFAQYLPGAGQHTNALVAHEYGRVVGHLSYEYSRSTFLVARLFVARMARRRGHGMALVSALRAMLNDARQTRIIVRCGYEDGDMQRFLTQMDFLCRDFGEEGIVYVSGLVPPQWRLKNRIAQYVEGV